MGHIPHCWGNNKLLSLYTPISHDFVKERYGMVSWAWQFVLGVVLL